MRSAACVRALWTGAIAALAGVCALAPGRAHADSYGWWGQLGPIRVSVWRFGDRDREGGWTRREATVFAAWAARLRDGLPPGLGIEIEESFGHDGAMVVTLLRCRTGDPRCAFPASRAPIEVPGWTGPVALDDDFAAAILAAVAQATGKDAPPPDGAVAPPLYTIQVLATRSAERAAELSRRIDRFYEHDGRYVFDQTCGPCVVTPEARVETDEVGGETIHRVIVGNYESPQLARTDLGKLARLGFGGAVIRPLAAPPAPPGRRVAARLGLGQEHVTSRSSRADK